MGWKFPWASSFNSDFNNDFSVSFTEKRQREVGVEYNYRREAVFEWRAGQEGGGEGAEAKFAAMCGTDAATYHRDRPGMSAFALEDGVVYHTYSTYARGVDGIWGMYQWLDRAPKGRNETGVWWRRHDEYDTRRAMSWRSCVTGIRKHLQHGFRGYGMFSMVFNGGRKLASSSHSEGEASKSNRGDELLQRTDGAAAQHSWWHGASRCVGSGTLLVLLPKCPVCIAAYLTLWTGASVAMSVATHLRPMLAILFFASALFLVVRCVAVRTRQEFSTGAPNPEKRPCTITKSPSATITPASYFRVVGSDFIRLNSPSRPGSMCALCWM